MGEYCALVRGRPALDEPTRSRRIDVTDVPGAVATATLTFQHGADTLTGIFPPARVDDNWRVADKAYHRHS